MTLPFDQLAINADELVLTALVLVVVVAGMRLFYGAWPWEPSKTWYHTRQAVAYVDALRGEKKLGPDFRPVQNAVDTGSDSFDRLTVSDTSVRGTSSDSFARLTVSDTPPPEVTPPAEAPPPAEQLRKSSVRRKSSQRTHPTRVETAPFITEGSDGGGQTEQSLGSPDETAPESDCSNGIEKRIRHR